MCKIGDFVAARRVPKSEAIVAFRCWYLKRHFDNTGRNLGRVSLRSQYVIHEEWHGGRKRAAGVGEELHVILSVGEPPTFYTYRGLHAFKSRNKTKYECGGTDVWGKVRLYGKVVECTEGYVAQYVEIIEFGDYLSDIYPELKKHEHKEVEEVVENVPH